MTVGERRSRRRGVARRAVIALTPALFAVAACAPPVVVACIVGAAASGATDAATAPPPRLDDVTKILGPFTLAGEDYTAAVHQKRLASAPMNDVDGDALASLEIRNAAGTVVHRESFEYRLDPSGFASSCSATVELLHGAMIDALLVGVGCLPSAPDSGSTWEVFGVWDGKFMRLGQPFTAHGEVLRFVRGPVTRIGEATSFGLDTLELRIWTGNFRAVVPLTLNWITGRVIGPRCWEQSDHGLVEGGCDVGVEADRVPADDDLTFIRLFDEPHESFGTPRHVVVRVDSTVEIVGAHVRVVLAVTPTVTSIDVGDDPWLHVRVDGKDGWIHTQEDFSAIGLPQAG